MSIKHLPENPQTWTPDDAGKAVAEIGKIQIEMANSEVVFRKAQADLKAGLERYKKERNDVIKKYIKNLKTAFNHHLKNKVKSGRTTLDTPYGKIGNFQNPSIKFKTSEERSIELAELFDYPELVKVDKRFLIEAAKAKNEGTHNNLFDKLDLYKFPGRVTFTVKPNLSIVSNELAKDAG